MRDLPSLDGGVASVTAKSGSIGAGVRVGRSLTTSPTSAWRWSTITSTAPGSQRRS